MPALLYFTGMSGHLLSVFGAELRGEEEKQHRLWRAVQRAVIYADEQVPQGHGAGGRVRGLEG